MKAKDPLTFYATFPDPNDADAPRGGYRRNIEMVQLLETHYKPTLVVAASHTFQTDVAMETAPVIIGGSCMPIRWVKTFRFLRRHCATDTPIVVYNPTLHTLPALGLLWLKYTIIVDYVDIQGTIIESENRLVQLLGVLVERLFIKTCRQFITSSTAIQKRISALNPRANTLLYRGSFQPPEHMDSNIPGIDLPPDLVKIMVLGMLQDFSGVRELLEAFIDLNPPSAHLYIVGHGPIKQECIRLAEQFAPGRVSFPELDDAHLHPFMQHMDILAVPYLDAPRNHANFPSKIIEYLWAGKAVLGTQVGEIQQALVNEQTALLVPPTQAGLLEGLQRLLQDRELRERLGQNARDEFKEHYHPSVVREALCAFIAGTVNGGK